MAQHKSLGCLMALQLDHLLRPNPSKATRDTCVFVTLCVYIYIYIYYESQPGSWLVAICERSENRGSRGGRSKIGKIGGDFSQTKVWFCRVMYQAAKQ